MLQGTHGAGARARALRKEMSLPEVLLWQTLRRRPGGLKFRRQHPAGRYVADFFCHEARLVGEIDGESHDRGDRPARDAQRDRWFSDLGFTVLRIPAREVLANLDGIVAWIVAQSSPSRGGGARQRDGGVSQLEDDSRSLAPLHRPAAGPSPPPGEDFVGSIY